MSVEKAQNPKLSNFYKRSITFLIIFPPALYAVTSPFLFFMLLFVVAILAGYEWNNICGKWTFGVDGMSFITGVVVSMTAFFMASELLGLIAILVFSYITYIIARMRAKHELAPVIPEHLNRARWMFFGSLYISAGFSALAYLGNLDPLGITLMWVFFATIVSDTFAYIFGSLIGGKKIAPKISPNKSWAGFFGGALSTGFLGYLFSMYFDTNNTLYLIMLGILMCVFAHVGDMLESAFKRYVGVKNSSNIMPGHGGVLDRIDAALMTAMFISILGIIMGKSPLFFMN